jgi:hypothetical protein
VTPKHSPGPWRWAIESESSNCLHGADGSYVATFDGESDPATDRGNRALLAAAPEMLDLLHRLEWRSDDGDGEDTPLDSCGICGGVLRHRPHCELAALLARIEGES